MQRSVQDVMTRDVVVANQSTPFRELVELLRRNRISALPVVDGSRHVVGVVSETDLMLKEVQALKGPGGADSPSRRDHLERAKAAGTTAADLMTVPAVTVYPEELVADAARRMHAWKLDQLPVVDHGGALIGIISRGDVLKVFLRSDQEIRFELLDDIAGRLLRLPAGELDIQVDGGVVTLAGQLGRRSRAVALAELSALVDGVVAVRDQLSFEEDDLHGARPSPARTAG